MSEHNESMNHTAAAAESAPVDDHLDAASESNEEAQEVLEENGNQTHSLEDEILQLKEQLSEAEAKMNEHKESAVRAAAEAENVRRRSERDVQNAHKFALDGFVQALLPVLDGLEQGLSQNASHEESIAMKQGMELTLKMFIDVLAKKQVEQLDPVGQVFNPEFHEAMSMQPSAEHEPNTIMAVFQKGYTLNGRLVRPARVVVSKPVDVANIDTKA